MNKSPLSIFQIDAFSGSLFHGNPAAVCPLERWLPDRLMQQIANENNLSETAFFVRNDEGFQIRWFTPANEVALCGHATLASAFVLFNILGYQEDQIFFQSKSGILKVRKDGERLTLNFPADQLVPFSPSKELIEAVGVSPDFCFKGRTDLLFVYSTQKQIESIAPDFKGIESAGVRGLMISAPGDTVDFVSRFFAPSCGVNEDPVTGSAHTTLIPYWSKRLNKNRLHAYQLSSRGGELFCTMLNDRVEISGEAVLYMTGTISLPAFE